MTPLVIPEINPEMDSLTAALAYADAGWYVLPVRLTGKRKKHPGSVVGDGWPAQSSRDPKTITAWFAGTNYGIALHCGRSGAVVLDVDDSDNVPDPVLAAMETTGCPYQLTRPDQPGRGHYVFANTTGRRIGNGLGRLAASPKWGEVRGANGVIVVAPTPHPEGGCYRWERTGPVPALPDYIDDALPNSTTPESTASDAEIERFLDSHTESTTPQALTGLVNALHAKLDARQSCHMSTLGVLTDAMQEAAAGFYDARTAVRKLYGTYLETATTGTSTGRRLTTDEARHEYRGIVAWAIGQAEAGVDKARDRIADKYGEQVGEVDGAELASVLAGVEDEAAEPTSWEPFDLGPWLAGERESPQPSVGISRTDGRKLIYAGREHTVFGETESGKSWFALESAAVEMRMGRDVVYVHYEEGDPASTIERLRLLGVTPEQLRQHLRFVAPARPVRGAWLDPLLNPPPALVIHDGVNEAMSLHGDDTNAADGAATFRRTIIKPFLAVGAASLSCDHVIKSSENRGRYAIGSGHKINAIDGAAFLMENIEPFGRGLRGASRVYITKDRPGQLRAHGKPTGLPGKTFFGVLAVDASPDAGPDFLTLFAPRPDDSDGQGDGVERKGWSLSDIGEMLHSIVGAEPDHTVKSRRELFAKMRDAGNMFRDDAMRQAADMLVVSGRLVEIPGRRGATGYRTASQTPYRETIESTASATASRTASPIGGDAVGRSRSGSASECRDAVGRSGTQSKEKHRQNRQNAGAGE